MHNEVLCVDINLTGGCLQWRDLPKEEKQHYEDRAKRIADEQAAKQEEADRAFNLSLQKFPPASPGQENKQQNGATPGQPGYVNGQQQQQQAQGNNIE